MSSESGGSKPGFVRRSLKLAIGGLLGLCTGAVAVYSNAIFDQVIKPAKPVANFALAGADGLTVTCENHASGESGWWDFGDGTQLEAFEADKQTVAHTYAKPGSYTIKLSVRNFLLEENSRTVAVDLTNPPNALPPTVTGLRVEPIREQAPATYRITGEMQNADEVVWRLGDRAEHTPAQAGPFERYVTFEKPGQYPIVLTALSRARAAPQVHVQSVSVTAPREPVYTATVTITDSATKVDVLTRTERISTPVATRSGPTKGFDKIVTAQRGLTIKDARIDTRQVAKLVKNTKVEVAKDGKTARVTGEWAVGADAVSKAAGGSDMTIPVMVTEERTVVMTPGPNRKSGAMDGNGQIVIELPPQTIKAANATRAIEVDLGLTQPNGQRVPIAKGKLDPAGNWSQPVTLNGRQLVAQATTVNGKVRVTFATGGAVPPKK
jgi:PKD repeat protein